MTCHRLLLLVRSITMLLSFISVENAAQSSHVRYISRPITLDTVLTITLSCPSEASVHLLRLRYLHFSCRGPRAGLLAPGWIQEHFPVPMALETYVSCSRDSPVPCKAHRGPASLCRYCYANKECGTEICRGEKVTVWAVFRL